MVKESVPGEVRLAGAARPISISQCSKGVDANLQGVAWWACCNAACSESNREGPKHGHDQVEERGAAGRKPAPNSTAPNNGEVAGGDGPASLPGYQEAVRFNQDAVEAVLRAGTVVAEGGGTPACG